MICLIKGVYELLLQYQNENKEGAFDKSEVLHMLI